MTLTLDTRFLADGTAIVTDADDTGARYVVWQDDDAECPNDWGNGHAYAYRTSDRYTADNPADALSETFYRAYSDNHDAGHALAVTRRYARVLLGWTAEQAERGIVTYSARGYSQSDWWELLAIDADNDAEGVAQNWEQWARGDVFAVMRETRTECDHGEHWEPGDILAGIYAEDAETAVEYALQSGLN